MEAVPRMPMIWLDLKEAGEFAFNAAVKKVGPGKGRRGLRGAGRGGAGGFGVCEGREGKGKEGEGAVWAPLGAQGRVKRRSGCLRGPWSCRELELGGFGSGRGE